MAISSVSNSWRPGVCTSTTRPTAPFEGQVVYETDTDKILVWNGSAWYPNWNLPWGIVTRTSSTSSTSFAGLTANLTTSSFTAISGRLYKITYTEPNVQISADAYTENSLRYTNTGGSTIQVAYYTMRNAVPTSFKTMYVGTLNAGSVVIAACNTSSVGGTNLFRNSSQIAHLVVEDIGPA